MLTFGVDVGAGKRGQTAMVALWGAARPEILGVRSWSGSPSTDAAFEAIEALEGQPGAFSKATAIVEAVWVGKNPQSALMLARQVGGWERMFEAVGARVLVVQPSQWREVLPRGAQDRKSLKAAARVAAGAVFGQQAHKWTEHVCEAALMALWGAREAQREAQLAAAIGRCVDGR